MPNKSSFVLLGPSDCGKSTLLNIIVGIEQQSAGDIYFNEKLIASPDKKVSLSPKKHDVAMVFQSYALMHKLLSLISRFKYCTTALKRNQ